jgi:NADPH-dependent curcumin reductase
MSDPRVSRQIAFVSRPNGVFRPSDFAMRQTTVPAPQPGQLLVKTLYLSLDPLLRIRMDAAPLGGSGAGPFPLDAAFLGPGVGEVVESGDPAFPAGSRVEGRLPWQDFGLVDAKDMRRVDFEPAKAALGVLGLPGFTAYVGLKLMGTAPGASLLISGAAGAVGSLLGQMGKAAGLTVTGLASGVERCAFLTGELGFDHAVDRTSPGLSAELAAIGGFDVYFDNVGGPLLVQAAGHMKANGTILICGLMAEYDGGADTSGGALRDLTFAIMRRQLTLRAYSSQQHKHLFQPFVAECAPLLRSGRLKLPELVTRGLEYAPTALEEVFLNQGFGKRMVQVAAEDGESVERANAG